MKNTENTAILDAMDNNATSLALPASDAANMVIANQPLREFVLKTLENYFEQLDPGMPPTQLYNLVLEEVEHPLFKSTLKYTKGNQCKAAILLGISRSTLRKKLKIYGLD